MTEWVELDPAKAQYGCRFGARVRNDDGEAVTLLEMPSGSVVIVGHMSCSNRESAERHAQRSFRSDADRSVSKAKFDSWRKA